MSVFYGDRGRNRDYGDEQGAPRAGRVGRFGPGRRREPDDRPLFGFSYDRAEGVIQLLVAFGVVGGAAALLSSGLFAPDAADARRREARTDAAPVSAAPAPQRLVEAPPARAEPSPVSPSRADAPAPAGATNLVEQAVPAAPVASQDPSPPVQMAMPAKLPEPLAPPPAELRERLDPTPKRVDDAPPPGRADMASQAEAAAAAAEDAAPTLSAEAPAARSAGESPARFSHCYLKLAGRVQSSGGCRVRHTEDAVVLEVQGKPLEIAHARGRVWTATYGGRSLGKVYRSGSCWGARGFYACEKG